MKHISLFEWDMFRSILDDILNNKYEKHWVARVKQNIFASSEEKFDIEAALSEWGYTGDSVIQPGSKCNICGQTDLVYLFKIRNMENGNSLWIGSDCIRRFAVEDTKSIAIYDSNGDRIMDDIEIDKVLKDDLKSLIKDAKAIRVLNILNDLHEKTGDPYVNSLYDQYANLGKFTPRQIVWLDHAMQKAHIEYTPTDFMVDVSNPFYINHVLNMGANSLTVLKKYLNRDQMERVDYQLSKKVRY